MQRIQTNSPKLSQIAINASFIQAFKSQGWFYYLTDCLLRGLCCKTAIFSIDVFGVFCLIQLQFRNFQQYFASIQKMVDFTFKGLFMTTSKGIPDLANLPASTTMARPYYTYSILVQSVFLLFFLLYFALSIFRVAKKIKNNKFQDVVDHDETTNKNATERNGENDNQNENEKEDKLVYQFDDQEEEEEKQHEKEADEKGDPMEKSENLGKGQKKEQEKAEEENYDDYHDQHEETFIELDKKLLFLQPFLIPFVVCNSLFAADPFTIVLLVLTIVSFIAFNIKKKLSSFKVAPFVFMILSLLSFISFFYNDHDLTT